MSSLNCNSEELIKLWINEDSIRLFGIDKRNEFDYEHDGILDFSLCSPPKSPLNLSIIQESYRAFNNNKLLAICTDNADGYTPLDSGTCTGNSTTCCATGTCD